MFVSKESRMSNNRIDLNLFVIFDKKYAIYSLYTSISRDHFFIINIFIIIYIYIEKQVVIFL